MNTAKMIALHEVMVQLAPIQWLATHCADNQDSVEMVEHDMMLMQQRILTLQGYIAKEMLELNNLTPTTINETIKEND